MARRILYLLILALTLFFGIKHYEELKLILAVLGRGDWRWLLAAAGVQFLWLVAIAATFQACYKLTGVRERLTRMVPLTTAANFINVVAPSYGAGALAVLLADGHRRGHPAGKVTTAAYLYMIYDYAGFLILLVLGFAILRAMGLIDAVLVGAALFAGSLAISLIGLTIIGVYSANRLGRATIWLSRAFNALLRPLLHREFISLSKAEGFAQDLAEGLALVRQSPRNLTFAALLALTRKVLMGLILYLVSIAYHAPFELPILLVSFAVSYLFTIASITPSGVGFVEGSMGLIQVRMGIDPATSAAIAIAYRGVTFWLTLLYGFFAIRMIEYRREPRPDVTCLPASAPAASPQAHRSASNPTRPDRTLDEDSPS